MDQFSNINNSGLLKNVYDVEDDKIESPLSLALKRKRKKSLAKLKVEADEVMDDENLR